MGILQDKVLEAVAEKLQTMMAESQKREEENLKKIELFTEQVCNLMEQNKAVLKELQLCVNNNLVWVMNTQQTMCDKQGIKLNDPMETNNG